LEGARKAKMAQAHSSRSPVTRSGPQEFRGLSKDIPQKARSAALFGVHPAGKGTVRVAAGP
jgi:hypothetical protein